MKGRGKVLASRTAREGGTPLARLRSQRGWTKEKAAKLAGVAYKTYEKVERGQTQRVTMTKLESIARAFRVDIRELMGTARKPKALERPIAVTRGIVDAVHETDAVVLFGEDASDVWLVPLTEIPPEAQHSGAALELKVYRYGPGDVRGTLRPVDPLPLTPAQRELLNELERIDQGR